MKKLKDFLLLVGVTSTGKTTSTEILKEFARSKNIPHEKRTLSDAQSIIRSVKEDDELGGYHHTHTWCIDKNNGHHHKNDEPIVPFIVTDNVIPEKMMRDFFKCLETTPITGKIYFVEWAGGINTYPKSDVLSKIDFSYTKTHKLIKNGTLPHKWLDRVISIIHLLANDDTRLLLNKKTPSFVDTAQAPYQVGWKRDEVTLRFFGSDDYGSSGLRTSFNKRGIKTYKIKNDASIAFYGKLKRISERIFENHFLQPHS